MNRFNYRQSAYDRLAAGASVPALVTRWRQLFAVGGAALAILATAWSVDGHRLAVLDGELTELRLRVQAAEHGNARAVRLAAAVARLRALDERIADARRDLFTETNTIAQIGNGLPAQTWLTSLGATPAGDWTIAGRSTRVDEIGTLLRRVQSIDRNATARLVSVAATGHTGRILDFIIAWNRRP